MNKKFLNGIGNFVRENGSTLSMFVGLGCIGAALYEAFRASDNISKANEEYASKVEEIKSEAISEDEKAAKIKAAKSNRNVKYILAYKLVGLFGVGAVGFSLLSKYLDGMALAGMTAFAMSKEDEIKAFVKNGKEMLGEEKFKELEDKTLENRLIDKYFGDTNAIRLDKLGGSVVVEPDDALLFQITATDLADAIDRAETYFKKNNQLSKSKFLEMLGYADIPKEAYEKWWGPKNPFKPVVKQMSIFGGVFKVIDYGGNRPLPAGMAGVQWTSACINKDGGK